MTGKLIFCKAIMWQLVENVVSWLISRTEDWLLRVVTCSWRSLSTRHLTVWRHWGRLGTSWDCPWSFQGASCGENGCILCQTQKGRSQMMHNEFRWFSDLHQGNASLPQKPRGKRVWERRWGELLVKASRVWIQVPKVLGCLFPGCQPCPCPRPTTHECCDSGEVADLSKFLCPALYGLGHRPCFASPEIGLLWGPWRWWQILSMNWKESSQWKGWTGTFYPVELPTAPSGLKHCWMSSLCVELFNDWTLKTATT